MTSHTSPATPTDRETASHGLTDTAGDQAPLVGLLGAFDSAEELVSAARQLYGEGYRRTDAFTPYPVEGLAEALGMQRMRLPALVLAGGVAGCVGGFVLQYWISVVDYPLNIGGRPLNSWPAFIPVTFEATILLAALAAVLGMLALNGLPRPHHPLFAVPGFERASTDRFFLLIERRDPEFDREKTATHLTEAGASGVQEVRDE